MLDHALVEALVATREERQRGLARELVDERVVEQPPGWSQRDHPPLLAELDRVTAVARAQRRLDHVDPQHHPGAAAERSVVDLAGAERRVVAVVDVSQPVAVRERVGDVTLALEPLERIREQREDVDLHHISRRGSVRSMSICLCSMSTVLTASATSGTSSSPRPSARDNLEHLDEGSAINAPDGADVPTGVVDGTPFEVLRPPFVVVQAAAASERCTISSLSAQRLGGGAIVVSLEPHDRPAIVTRAARDRALASRRSRRARRRRADCALRVAYIEAAVESVRAPDAAGAQPAPSVG